jgi:biopolymer transport protein ExbD
MRMERRLKPQISLDLTPLIDVVFQLVIFFMISTTFNTAPGIEIESSQLKNSLHGKSRSGKNHLCI